jgi:nucleotide-binding universal stress UspA family protein
VNILIAVDRSEYADAAVHAVLSQFAGQQPTVRLLHVVNCEAQLPLSFQFGQGPQAARAVLDFEGRLIREASQHVEKLAAELREAGCDVTIDLQPHGDPKAAIVEAAASWPADLIVMGSHGRTGIDRFLLGSVSESVVHHAPCSVQVVRLPRAASVQDRAHGERQPCAS